MSELASLLPLIAIFAIFWLLVIRPAQRRQKEMRNVQSRLSIGDEVLTNSGIFGTVTRIDDDRIGLEIADAVVVTIARGAVVGVQKEAGGASGDDATVEPTDDDRSDTDPADPADPGDQKGL